MRISDWSSDVCSSDLRQRQRGGEDHGLDRIPGLWPAGIKIELIEPVRFRPLLQDIEQAVGVVAVAAGDPGSGAVAHGLLECLQRPHCQAPFRSDDRRVGKDCVSTFSSPCFPSFYKTLYLYLFFLLSFFY